MRISTDGTELCCDLAEWVHEHFPTIEVLPPERYKEADLLICGDFSYKHEKFNGIKLFYTGENHAPNLNLYDYCLTHEPIKTDRCHRLPYWLFNVLVKPGYRQELTESRPVYTAESLTEEKREFCAFVCRNPVCRKRNRIVRNLSKQRRVNCGGPLMNNIGYCVKDKEAFMHGHYFAIVYENEAHRGYQTEKLPDALRAHTIPVYWGNPDVCSEFNPHAFIHARDFPNERALRNHILALAEDPERMAAILNAPPLATPDIISRAEYELTNWFAAIFTLGPRAIRRTRFQRIHAVLERFYGHGLFRSLRRISRYLRGK